MEEEKKWEINGQNLNTDNEEKEQQQAEKRAKRGQLCGCRQDKGQENIQHFLTQKRKKTIEKAMMEE